MFLFVKLFTKLLMEQNQDFTFEIKRKLFHLLALIFPISYVITTKLNMSIALTIITGFTLFMDISRHYNEKIKGVVELFFVKIMRKNEKNTKFLSGASNMALGFLLTALFFPKNITIMSWFILLIADCNAAIIGIKYGKALFNGKSLEGSIAFFLTSIIIGAISSFLITDYKISISAVLLSAVTATLVEFFSGSWNINDNISIPLSYAIIMSYFLYF
jgi:dolichol kinase